MTQLDIDGRGKTFGLWHPRQALLKLRWEYDMLVGFENDGDDRHVFAAFNAASTAWHLAEWTWHTLPQLESPPKNFARMKDFYADCLTGFPELDLCRQIANGGKHFRLEGRHDIGVRTSTMYMLKYRRDQNGKIEFVAPAGNKHEQRLAVSCSGKIVKVRTLIADAAAYWDERLTRLGYKQYF